ncbi:DUF6779 domain-containing protein [Amycolatopsis taiwanensis]|uniref:DUF6779 domain-containing protein n=1 Tax=Amycolatopsis taiwanensis TaxID=342230 RepID=A0A9W6R3H1_9PSEU|nr:DUF6779 domain-containing protein [Amycolatopsis taiwanensis]GLY68568.1 hypothetical protein Atai01_51870 [Amycolatopsis taiwanensis]
MTGVGDDARGRSSSWSRPWFWGGVALAVGATVALVLANDIRYLRFGIVAALWAAIVGAYLAVRYRKQAVSTEETVAQAQQVYELELEREIAARREYELEIESETRQRVADDSRAELDALRAEIGALRDNLQSLFGGEVLLERLSLTAQATRMRALRDEQRLVEPAAGNARPALEAATSDLVDRPTELIERVREKQPARPAGRAAAPEPRRPDRSLDLPPRRVTKGEPVPARGANAVGNIAKAPESLFESADGAGQGELSAPPERRRAVGAEAREQTRVQQPATPPPPGKKPMPPGRSGPVRSERSRPSMRPADPGPIEQPTQVSKVLDADRAPAWEAPTVKREPSPPAAPTRQVPAVNGAAKPPRKPAEPAGESAVNQPTSLFTPPAKETVPLARREPKKPAEPPAGNPTVPEEARRQGRSGLLRRRSVEEDATAAPEGGGRRHRPDDESPSWTQPAAGDGVARRRAGHSRPELEPVAEPGRTGRRAGAKTDATSGETGSHSSGRSVSELLAAHGSDAATPRRRRRAED